MTLAKPHEIGITHLLDHTELPESDGTFVKNFQERPQSILLTDSIRPVLRQLHPDGQYGDGRYELLNRNQRGHYAIAPMGIELGIWQGRYEEMELPWLRWWDNQGNNQWMDES